GAVFLKRALHGQVAWRQTGAGLALVLGTLLAVSPFTREGAGAEVFGWPPPALNTAVLSVNVDRAMPNDFVVATWSDIRRPTALDWIGLYSKGSDDTSPLQAILTDGTAGGEQAVHIPPSVPAGTYELRLFANNGFLRLATSSSFVVGGSEPEGPTT